MGSRADKPSVEEVSIKVPVGKGYVIGDLLRKCAVCDRESWQVVAFQVSTTSPSFGFSDGNQVSYLVLLKGALVCKTESNIGRHNELRIAQFHWNGSCYENEEFQLLGVPHAVGDSIVVCVRYSSGHYSATQNYDVLLEYIGNDIDSWYTVPSSHSKLSTFRYKVTNLDQSHDCLTITADCGAVTEAHDSVIKTLMGLSI